MELFTKYLISPTVNAVKTDILKLNAEIVKSDKPIFSFKEIDMAILENHIQNPHRNIVRMLLKILAYQEQDTLLPDNWEIEHIFPQKWQDNYFTDVSEITIKEKIEYIGNKVPFEKKLNIIAGNGYFGKKKKEYLSSNISITKKLGTLEIDEWNLDSIMTRNIRILDSVKNILRQWNDTYNNISIDSTKETQPTDSDLEKIEEYKRKGWI